MTQTTALVTGGTGFVGSNLVRRLVAQGWNVHLIARHESDTHVLQDLLPAIEVHRHDGTTEGLGKIVKDAQASIVFHLASYFRAEHKSDEIVPMLQSNLIFPTQLLEAMVENGVRLLVNTGTTWQNYENRAYSPVCLYAATKQGFEDILQYYVEARAVSAITLKLSDTFGPSDPRPKLLNQLARFADEGRRLSMSPGEQLMDIVHIDDVIDAFALAAQRLLDGKVQAKECYAVRSSHVIPLKALVERFTRERGIAVEIAWGERPYRQREVMTPPSLDPLLPGWSAKRSIFS